jgi:hypothetical protein
MRAFEHSVPKLKGLYISGFNRCIATGGKLDRGVIVANALGELIQPDSCQYLVADGWVA